MPKAIIDIRVAGLSFSYPAWSESVLRGLSLTITRGEFVGIIGPNGCGKTTLLKCLTKVLPIERGEVEIAGRSLIHLSTRELANRVAVVPQQVTLAFPFTVREVVTMGRYSRRRGFTLPKKAEETVIRRSMEFVGIGHLADRPVTNLSGGEFQRVMIAQALAQEPQILLLDEATSNLDINYQVEILDIVSALNSEWGMTVVAVMHDLNLAAQYCSRLILLKEGTVYAMGTAEEVISTETIRQVYGANVVVAPDAVTGKPHVFLIPRRAGAAGKLMDSQK